MSYKALQTAVTGMSVQERRISGIADNLANVNTTGFKKGRMDFTDLMYEQIKSPGSKNSTETISPVGIQIGHGARLQSAYKDFSQGQYSQTGRNLDVAIEGKGFVKVTLDDGSIAYTRDCSFKTDADGNLVTPTGYKVEPNITVPETAENVIVGTDGIVTVSIAGETSVTELGTVQLALFSNPSGLKYLGKGLYQESDASGSATDTSPGQEGAGTLLQGYLESSNVNVAEELINMVIAQRTYEANSRVIQTTSEMMRQTNNVG